MEKVRKVFVMVSIAMLLLPVMSFAGDLEPSGPPAPTMKSLDKIPPAWSQKLPATERFDLVFDGYAVLDKETGLVWERSPMNVSRTWQDAVSYCLNKSIYRLGWHLPTIEQLMSLVDLSVAVVMGQPRLPSGHPFNATGMISLWSASTSAYNTSYAYYGQIQNGGAGDYMKTQTMASWCVRGGQSADVP